MLDSLQRFGRAFDRAQDPHMCAALAQVIGQFLADLLVARCGIAMQQRRRLHDHAVNAVTTLHGLFIDKGLLQRMQDVAFGQTFKRGDTGTYDGGDGHQARPQRLAIEQYRASTALTQAATELGAMKSKFIAQRIEKWHIWIIHFDCNCFLIHNQ
jgi:hypothetical protein